MTATAEITVATLNDALLVPNAALRFTPPSETEESNSANLFTRLMPRHGPGQQQNSNAQDRSGVWVLDKGTPRRIAIKTGMTNGRYTAVLDGTLKAGDRVIVGATTAKPK